MGVGFFIMAGYLLHSLLKGKSSGSNPWGSRSLEWQTPSPVPLHNFEYTPVIINGPYDYHKPMSEFQLGIATPHNGHDHHAGEQTNISETEKEQA